MDIILVGDSVGNTMLGHSTTMNVTVDVMVHHTAAVRRTEPEKAYWLLIFLRTSASCKGRSPTSLYKVNTEGGAEAVKIEGNSNLEGTLNYLIDAGIPIMGHVGLLPQRVHTLGGYRKFGKTNEEHDSLLEDATAMQRQVASLLSVK